MLNGTLAYSVRRMRNAMFNALRCSLPCLTTVFPDLCHGIELYQCKYRAVLSRMASSLPGLLDFSQCKF